MQQRKAAPTRLTGATGALATVAASLPILIGFGAPAYYLADHAIRRAVSVGLPPELGVWILNTVLAAAGATAICIVFGLVVAYTGRFARHRFAGVLVRLTHLGYAVPGTVLAAGMLMPFATLDNVLANTIRDLTGERVGLILSGFGIILISGYVIRFLAIAVGGIEAGLSKISPSVDMAARSLGSRPVKMVRTIHLPLLRPAVAAAGLLVFVDCMKELPLTLLLRPFGFETLSTTVYGEAARGTYEFGAIAALMIVLVGLGPVILLARTSFRDAPKRSRRTVGDPASAITPAV